MPFREEFLKHKNSYFVETGTYQGDTVAYALNGGFPNVLSMELSEVFFKRCEERFKDDPRVKIFLGNSRYDLSKMIQPINAPITFWLDGHWSGVPDIGVDAECICPVLYELEQIKAHPIKTHTIMVDDIRLMDGHHFPVLKHQIEQMIMEINPNYVIQYFDDYTSPNDVLIATIP